MKKMNRDIMKQGSKENNHETSSSPTQRLSCREISTADDYNIPLDLTVEILKKLPAKSLVRFQCVSKQWSSIIGSQRDFTDSIVTRSLTQSSCDAHLIFHHFLLNNLESVFFIFSSTYPQNIDKESVPTLCHLYQYVRGLIFFWSTKKSYVATIYNPTTRQSFSLPEMERGHFDIATCFLGYDPLKNQYKVMCIRENMRQFCQVFTLGDPKKEWRNIQCNVGLHFHALDKVCIMGTLYYQTSSEKYGSWYVLMSFDVRSEKFYHVEAPKTLTGVHTTLINYKEKLGLIYVYENSFEIWVMKDHEKKQEWSRFIFYEMEGFAYFFNPSYNIAGMTRGGEIVFVNWKLHYEKLYVYYYDPKQNSMRRVEVKNATVVGKEHRRKHMVLVWPVLDHVENTMRL